MKSYRFPVDCPSTPTPAAHYPSCTGQRLRRQAWTHRPSRIGVPFATRSRSTPHPVQPHPLRGMAADPGLDDGCDHLHGCGDVYPAIRIAGRLDRTDDFVSEASLRQADDARAINLRIEGAGQPHENRIHPAAPAEKYHLDPVGLILVDQHADQGAMLERGSDLRDGVRTAWNRGASAL